MISQTLECERFPLLVKIIVTVCKCKGISNNYVVIHNLDTDMFSFGGK